MKTSGLTMETSGGKGRSDSDDGVAVVDAQGRVRGTLITDRALFLDWRAAREMLSDQNRWKAHPQSVEPLEEIARITREVPVFVRRDNGLIERRPPEGEGHAILPGSASLLGPEDLGAFMRHAQTVDGYAGRELSESFEDHYRKATVFWRGLSVRGRAHLVDCARLELGKVESGEARRRVIAQLHRVDEHLARRVAKGLYYPRGAGEVAPIILWK